MASLHTATFLVTDLGDDFLGLAFVDGLIVIDDDAAGRGWFIDPTPGNDIEFLLSGNQGEHGRMDLLSVVMHELGHVLGFVDLDTTTNPDEVMAATLFTGIRRTPTPRRAVVPIAETTGLASVAADFESADSSTVVLDRQRHTAVVSSLGAVTLVWPDNQFIPLDPLAPDTEGPSEGEQVDDFLGCWVGNRDPWLESELDMA